MMREMRRQDRLIELDDAKQILAKAEYGFLATVGEDGQPYAVPVSYAYADDKIWIHAATEGRKLENIKFHPEVQFSVVGDTELMPEKFGTKFESAMAFGTIRECETVEEKKVGLMHIVRKYSFDFMEGGAKYADGSMARVRVFCIENLEISGKRRAK